MTAEQPLALKLADALDKWAKDYAPTEHWDAMGVNAAAELRRLHKLCYDYLGELTAMRAAKQMQARIDELKGQGEWNELTEEEVLNFYMFWVVDRQDIIGFYKAVERKLKERNT